MPIITEKMCWDLLEKLLISVSETKTQQHCGTCLLSISVIVSAGRDNDEEWLNSDLFKCYCKSAFLSINETRELLKQSLEYVTRGEFYTLHRKLRRAQ